MASSSKTAMAAELTNLIEVHGVSELAAMVKKLTKSKVSLNKEKKLVALRTKFDTILFEPDMKKITLKDFKKMAHEAWQRAHADDEVKPKRSNAYTKFVADKMKTV
jgi:hypothetical protein